MDTLTRSALSSERLVPWTIGIFLVVNVLGKTICLTPLLRILELSVCRTHYSINDPSVIGSDGSVPEELCKIDPVQVTLAQINGTSTLLAGVTGLLAALPYYHYSGRFDRRPMVLLELVGWALGTGFTYFVCFNYDTLDLRLMYLSSLSLFIGGGYSIAKALIYAILTESVSKTALSKVLFYISGSVLACAVLGRSFGGWLMSNSLWLPVLLGFIVYACCIPILMAIPEPRSCGKSEEESDLMSESSIDEIATRDGTTPANPRPAELSEVSEWSWNRLRRFTFRQASRMSTPRSPDTLRVLIGLLVFSAFNAGDDFMNILPQWTSRFFHYSLASTNYLLSFADFMAGLSLYTLPRIKQWYLSRNVDSTTVDYKIASGSLVVACIGTVCMGLSPNVATLYGSLGIYKLSGGFHDALKAYLVATISRRHITRFYIAVAITERLATLIGAPFWAMLMSLSLCRSGWCSSLPLGVSTVFLMLAAASMWLPPLRNIDDTRGS